MSLSNVHQTPTDVLGELNSAVKLSCSHITSFDTILWYQRSVGDTALKLIGHVYYRTDSVETPFNNSFTISGDAQNEVHLHVQKLRRPEDTGEYFCAARIHSDRESYTLIQIPPGADAVEPYITT